MLAAIKRAGARGFMRVEGAFDKVFGPAWNPLYQLGALGWFFFWIVAVSGIYLFVVFDTSVKNAYQSVEYLTHEQWYLGGVMRSFHRYASDAMVVVVLIHLFREFVFDRYRGMRWFAWVTGVPLLWLLYASGITGYWLVWDKLAQYVAIVTSELLDWFPIFGEPIARNFLNQDSLDDRFFTLLVFMHIAVPLFLLLVMWVHLLRVSRAKVNPPLGLAAGMLVTLLALSLYKPALSQGEANLSVVAANVGLDWFYLPLYPLLDIWPAGAIWLMVGVATLVLTVVPWLPPKKKEPVAEVNPDLCNGCSRCFVDCPFGAVTMSPRTDGRPYESIAEVDSSICVSCGICVGACPPSTPFRRSENLQTGIDLPGLSLQTLRETVDGALAEAKESASGQPTILLLGCDHGLDAQSFTGSGTAAVTTPCVSMLSPSFIDYAVSRGGADGVMITGCREGECFFRLGNEWMMQRIDGERDPYLRERVPRDRLDICWASPTEGKTLTEYLNAFREDLTDMKTAGEIPDQAAPKPAGPPPPPSKRRGDQADEKEDRRYG